MGPFKPVCVPQSITNSSLLTYVVPKRLTIKDIPSDELKREVNLDTKT